MGFTPKRNAASISSGISIARCIYMNFTGEWKPTQEEEQRARGFDDALSWLIEQREIPTYIERFCQLSENTYNEAPKIQGRRTNKNQ